MNPSQKNRVLARLEGQLHRWGFGQDPAVARRRVVALLRILQSLPDAAEDGVYPRRLADNFTRLVRIRCGTPEFRACVTLVRVDCLLWQRHLSLVLRSMPQGRPCEEPAA